MALLILVPSRPEEAPPEPPQTGGPLDHFRLAPLAVAAAGLNAAIEAASLALLPLCARAFGWTEVRGTSLLSVLLVGAIL